MFIVPLLLYRKTRTIAFIAALIFHLFNSFTLHIGIFPYFSLAILVFFIPTDLLYKLFPFYRPKGEELIAQTADTRRNKRILLWFFIPYFLLQILLPVRHFFIKGDVAWTEEGHRLSWRMMLRARSGYAEFKVVDKKTGQKWVYDLNNALTPVQRKQMETRPDMLWQMAQRIKNEYHLKNQDVAVYITAKASLNKSYPRLLIDPSVDMALAKWNYFAHNTWILLYE